MKKSWIWVIAIIVILVLGGFIFNVFFLCGKAGSCDSDPYLTDDQIRAKIYELYGGDSKRVSVYPDSKMIYIEIGKSDTFAIVIRNLENTSLRFSYNISIEDNQSEKYCNTSKQELLNMINNGKSMENISISSGELYLSKVNLSFNYGDPVCVVRYLIRVYANGEPYGVEEMDVSFRP